MRPTPAVPLLAFLFATSCHGSASETCVSGQSAACAGPASCAGFQVCGASGSYGACVCGGDAGPGDSGDSGSDAGGAFTLVTGIQQPPVQLASDGTTLYWVEGTALRSVPVGGGTAGTIATVGVSNTFEALFLAVDGTRVYLIQNGGIYGVPKTGGAPVLISEPTDGSANLAAATVLAGDVYWADVGAAVGLTSPVTVRSAPLSGGPASAIGGLGILMSVSGLGVTSSSLFVASLVGEIETAPVGTLDAGILPLLPGIECLQLVSDTDAVYCRPRGPSIAKIAVDGTVTTLAAAATPTDLAIDAENVYWVDDVQAGTVMAVPKAGGSPRTLAHDTSPNALAVDARFVYWSDEGGNIMRAAK